MPTELAWGGHRWPSLAACLTGAIAGFYWVGADRSNTAIVAALLGGSLAAIAARACTGVAR